MFGVSALVGVGLPLFVVTLASQNRPGVAAQRAPGYDTPVPPVITTTGLAAALKDGHHRDAAALTFPVTPSGLSLAGIGPAFRGVVAGAVAPVVQHYRLRR